MTTRPKNPNLVESNDDQDEDVRFDKTLVRPSSALQETFSERTVVMPRSQMPDYMPPTPKAEPEPTPAPKAAPAPAPAAHRETVSFTPPPAHSPAPSSAASRTMTDETTQPAWAPTSSRSTSSSSPSWQDIPVPTPQAPQPKPKTGSTPKVSAPADLPPPAPMTPPFGTPKSAPWQSAVAPQGGDDLRLESQQPPPPHPVPHEPPPARMTGSFNRMSVLDETTGRTSLSEEGRREVTNVRFGAKPSPIERFKSLPRGMQVAFGACAIFAVIIVLKLMSNRGETVAETQPKVEPKVAEAPQPPPSDKPVLGSTEAVLTQFDQAFFRTQGQARNESF